MYLNINEIVSIELRDMKRAYDRIKAFIQKDSKELAERNARTGQEGEALFINGSIKGIVYYKHCKCNGKQRSIRLGGANNAEVIAIKQRKYNMTMLRNLRKNIKLLEKINGKFIPYDQDSIDEQIGDVYRDDTGLVNKALGIVASKEWHELRKKNKYKKPDAPNVAPDGLETRSKSEIIVYGIMKGYGLKLKYDMEIKLRDDSGQIVTVCPDFVILCNDGSMIIIEHLGMLDKDEYLENTFIKIHLYLINGYKLNKNLFLTADYAKGKIDAQAVDELVRKMILPRVKGVGSNQIA